MGLSEREIERYSRQLILSGWSSETQLALQALRVSVPASLPTAALYLAAAGLGSISIVRDSDSTDWLLTQARALNPDIEVQAQRSPIEEVDIVICFASDQEKLQGKLATFTVDRYAGTVTRRESDHDAQQSFGTVATVGELPLELSLGSLAVSMLLDWLAGSRPAVTGLCKAQPSTANS